MSTDTLPEIDNFFQSLSTVFQASAEYKAYFEMIDNTKITITNHHSLTPYPNSSLTKFDVKKCN